VNPVAVRNVLVIVAIAAAVAFLPGGGDTADVVAATLSVAILAAFVMIFARLYREHRMTIFGLGDRDRGILYGSLGVVVVAMAARERLFDTGAGTGLWFALMIAAGFGLYVVWRNWRTYRI
jgi:hypothetical protein